MIDPFTALAGIKAAVSAGKELVSVTKQIGEFFDGVDDLRNKHTKKKNSCNLVQRTQRSASCKKGQQHRDQEKGNRHEPCLTR